MDSHAETSDEGDARGFKTTNKPKVVAKMSAQKHARFYNMNHPKRGLAVIFNHKHFEEKTLESRSGTSRDRDNLKMSLIGLGFDVEVYDDLSYKEIIQVIEEAAETDHSECDCLVIAVLSHGMEGFVYAKDVPYRTDYLWTSFAADRCPTLAGKPKIFFIQACQGREVDRGVKLVNTEVDGSSTSYKIPTYADFLIVHSTIPGYISWRNPNNGSWFIQALCLELDENGYEFDILTILTFVSQNVAVCFESKCPNMPSLHDKKQIPCVISMLTRVLKFENK